MLPFLNIISLINVTQDDDNFMDDESVQSDRVQNNDELDDLELEPVVRTPARAAASARGAGRGAGMLQVVPCKGKG